MTRSHSTNAAQGHRPTISVIVPSYRRPLALSHCLDGLVGQRLAPGEILVVAREGDDETAAVVRDRVERGRSQVRLVPVAEAGVLAAMQAGAAASTGRVVAFIDDDAIAPDDWLERLVGLLTAHDVGAAGGRDVVAGVRGTPATDVGRITRLGGMVGNHHLGAGRARDVDVLKGVNIAFRREALALPRRLRGGGAQVHWEVATSQWARARGWRLVYDPSIAVDHRPASRFDADQRDAPTATALSDAAFNYERGLLAARPELYWRRALYGTIVGQRDNPGLLRAAAAALSRDWSIAMRLRPSLAGRWSGLRASRGDRLDMITFQQPRTPGA